MIAYSLRDISLSFEMNTSSLKEESSGGELDLTKSRSFNGEWFDLLNTKEALIFWKIIVALWFKNIDAVGF